MASRLGQHILSAKSKAENFGLFALYSSYLFFLSAFGCPMEAVVLRILSFFEIQIQYFHVDIKNHSLWPRAPLIRKLKRKTLNVKLNHNSQSNWEICGNYFYTSWWKGETCQGFANSIKWVGEKSPIPLGGGVR